MGRVAGDTAVVLLLGGGTLQLDANGSIPGLNVLQGTGSTLTTYVYANSPSGEGGAPQKAYAAAFLLLVLVLVLNWAVDRIARGNGEARMDPLMPPPPIRRIVVEAPHVPGGAAVERRRRAQAARAPPAPTQIVAAHAHRGADDRLRRQGRGQRRLAAGPPGRGAGADRALGLRQDDAAAFAEPARRADARRRPRRADRARRRRRRHARGHAAAPARVDGLPAAEPVPDVDLRQRRLRAARAGLAARQARRAGGAGARGARRAPGSGTRSATTSTGPRCGCRAASSSGCASPARWPRGPRCCCSTSRARRWTRARRRSSRS